jgi:acyl-CoA synthetase (AMP-forming)/AMP-acid ligase II
MQATLLHRLADAVRSAPEAEALVQREHRMRYRELWEGVGAVASLLRSQGLERGQRVGILMENCPEYAAIYYGVHAAGGAVVALNTESKARGSLACLRHSEASWLFADARHPELPAIARERGYRMKLVTRGRARGEPIPQVTASWEEIASGPRDPIDFGAISYPDQLAQLIYTSGTTGHPKAVMLSHRNLVANVRSIIEYLALSSADSILNVLPFHYSYGNSVLHTHLAVGARLVLENSSVYPHRILQGITDERVTGFSGVPSTFALLLSRTRLADFDLSSLRYLTQAGGPMPPVNVVRLSEALPEVRLFVMYGQTEATARLSYLPPERLADKLGSCGIPIPGVEIEIRDREGKSLPPGHTGEICASGENVMLGYWRAPEATRRVLQEGWLRTGDLAHRDEDGFIFIDGRCSDMIKSGAHRISPKEIEEVIAEIDGVAEVAVTGAADEILGEVVKALVVPADGAALDGRAVQRHCMRQLARYKVPKLVEFSREIPRTASGKIRRHLL